MSWINVKLIFLRELRDQLRDRRTLFTIAVLPLLLYPLLGMTFLQITQFLKEHPTRVWILGAESIPVEPALLQGKRFNLEFCSESMSRLLELTIDSKLPDGDLREIARSRIESGEFDAVVHIPPTFADDLAKFRKRIEQDDTGETQVASEVPTPQIYVNTASDKSRIAFERVDSVLSQWRESIGRENLRQRHVPVVAARPFEVGVTELAEDDRKRAAIWSKILPFVVLVWALTGAFYPAVDLCAGEKERGTLETLLTSPAQRIEIVLGKLLTVMSFSMATSLLNLTSMGLTGTFLIAQMSGIEGMPAHMNIGPPPPIAFVWLILALIPCAALFSALSLAIAAFARSSREGQYYLMPLLLGSLPLMMLPLLPAAELDLGTSLIPITGVLLLLRALIEGQYWDAARYFVPVTCMTVFGVFLATRWAVHQFNSESVLFRESERFDIRLWLQRMFRDRGDLPTPAQALFCGVLLLLIRFFAGVVAVMPTSWDGFVRMSFVTQIAFIATPACMMAIILTRRPAATLSLGRPSFWSTIPAAAVLALAIHPLMFVLQKIVLTLYPFTERAQANLEPIERLLRDMPLGWMLLSMAVAPAICEELAFRGFILSGLRRLGHKWYAIFIASILFGIAHFILQQSILAAIVGMALGYIAVKTSSLWPAVVFHLVHNATKLIHTRVPSSILDDLPWLQVFCKRAVVGEHLEFTWLSVGLGTALALVIILWLKRLPYKAFAEEELQDLIDRKDRPAEYVTA